MPMMVTSVPPKTVLQVEAVTSMAYRFALVYENQAANPSSVPEQSDTGECEAKVEVSPANVPSPMGVAFEHVSAPSSSRQMYSALPWPVKSESTFELETALSEST